jgi:hypothetical protein
MPIQPMENMKTPHTFREEWMKSRYSTAEHYIPYEEYYAARVKSEPVKSEPRLQARKARNALKDANKMLAASKKAVKKSIKR